MCILFQGDLGILYLDLYSREGKYPGCAHFAIRGGRRMSDTEYQLPVGQCVIKHSHSLALLDYYSMPSCPGQVIS